MVATTVDEDGSFLWHIYTKIHDVKCQKTIYYLFQQIVQSVIIIIIAIIIIIIIIII